MELLIGPGRAAAIRHAHIQGWRQRRGSALVWEREGGVIVRYVDGPNDLMGWPRGTLLVELPGASRHVDTWSAAHRLVALGVLRV